MRSYLFTVLAFAALLLGVTTACNRDAAGIGTGARGSVGSITVTIGGKEGPVSESPFVYKP